MERVYLDMCSLKRPFDDQRQPRVREEATAVAAIVARAEAAKIALGRLGEALRILVVAPRALAWENES